MAQLTLNLLGSLELISTTNATMPNFRSDKIRALLAYLALESGRPHERRSLAGLLWPEFPERASLSNLRKALFYLRQSIDELSPKASDALLNIDRKTVQFQLNGLTVDVIQFLELLTAVEQHPHRHLHLCHICLDRLTQASTLYQGELLAGFSLRQAAAFEEWLLFQREHLHQQAISGLSQLTTAFIERGDHEQALVHATRQVGLDRFREEAHRQVMRLLTLSGQHNQALAQYETCRRLLHEELGVEPEPETTALFHQIQAAQRGETVPAAQQTAVLHYFPNQFTPFIGREHELAQIKELFLDPECRLLTLVGPGGMGKTRLSIQAAQQLAELDNFVDDVYFFPLAAVYHGDALLMALVRGLDVALSARALPKDRLLAFLQPRRCLLVLDNFEQLVDCADFLAEMLAASPGLRLLVSSHIPLQIRAEKRMLIGGLDYPTANESAANVSNFSAVRLFAESARYGDATFQLNEQNQNAVVQICQYVQGMPLALELAAAWVAVLDCDAIAQEIGRNLEFLSFTPQDKPQRHQGMTAIFTYSWQLLGSDEQTILGQLAVFHGPFTLEAATKITETSPLTMARLLDKSLLQRRQDGRFELHPMLRQFINQQMGQQDEQVVERYCNYYLNLVSAQKNAFYGPHPRQAVAAVQQDLANIRQAWQEAIQRQYWSALENGLDGLAGFYHIATQVHQGESVFREARQIIEEQNGAAADLKFNMQIWQAFFLYVLGRHAEAIELANLALESTAQDEARQAQVYSLLGHLLPADGQTKQAIEYLEAAISYFRRTSTLTELARALRRMVLACMRGSEMDKLLGYAQEAIPLHQALEHKRGLAQLYNLLAGFYFEQNDLAQALAAIEQSRDLYEEIEDKIDTAVVAANLASLYSRLGKFEQALASNQQAIDICQEMGDRPGLSRDLSNRGAILAKIGQFESSLDCYYRALEIEKELGNTLRMAYFQAGIAAVYQMDNDYETAQAYYDLALPVLLEEANPFHVVGPLLDKADLLLCHGEWAEAQEINQQAMALVSENHLPEYIHRSRVLNAKIAFEAGDKAAAVQQLTDLLAETEAEVEKAALYYEVWQMNQDKANAEAALAAYQEAYDQVPSYINKKRLAELQSLLNS